MKTSPYVTASLTEIAETLSAAAKAAEEGNLSTLQELARNSYNDTMFWEATPDSVKGGIRTASRLATLDPDDKPSIVEAIRAVSDATRNFLQLIEQEKE
jgi:hypothetical protein